MLSILAGYVRMSRAIAAQRRSAPAAMVLADTIVTRLITGMNEAYYAYFDLWRKPMRERFDYLTKPTMDRLLDEANGGKTVLLDDKIAFYHRMKHVIPTPEILAVVNPERMHLEVPSGLFQIEDCAGLARFLATQSGRRLIVKPAASSYGFGVMAIVVDGQKVVDHLGTAMPVARLYESLLDLLRQSGSGRPDVPASRCFIVQPQLAPHPSLRPVIPGPGLGTFRITTYRDRSGTVRIPFAHAKIPQPDAAQDNFHGGSTGNVIRRVDPVTGIMSTAWGKRKADDVIIERLKVAPGTSTPYADFRIEAWQELCAIAIAGAHELTQFRTVGWDVALTTNGPMILEGNGHYDPDCIQTTLDRGIKREIEALFRT